MPDANLFTELDAPADVPQEPAPRARRTDPATSHIAAESMQGHAKAHRHLILSILSRPMTIYEIAALTTLDHVQVARRMSELEEMGQAHTTGTDRPGPTGRPCREWARGKNG